MDYIYYVFMIEEIFFEAVGWIFSHLPLIATLIFMIFMNYTQRNKNRKKFPPIKKPQPKAQPAPSDPRDIGFEIPELKRAPEAKPQDGVYREQQSADSLAIEAEELADEQNRYMKYLKEKTEQEKIMREEEEKTYRAQAKLSAEARKPLELPPVTPQALATGIIYEEILGKPKALRRRKF